MISEEKYKNRKFEIYDIDKVDTKALEVFDYKYPGKNIEITIVSEEFTSVCPFTGLPDFGKITIKYVPYKKCIELKSLKYYLLSYRNVGIFYEHVVNKILEDLVMLCNPIKMIVEIDFTIRGGLKTTVKSEFFK